MVIGLGNLYGSSIFVLAEQENPEETAEGWKEEKGESRGACKAYNFFNFILRKSVKFQFSKL